MQNLTACSLVLAACSFATGSGTVEAAQPQRCADAASSVAVHNPLSGSFLRIIKAEDQAASEAIRANCLVEGALNERISAVDGKPYGIKFRLRMPQGADWNGKFYMEGGGGANGILTEALGLSPGTSTNAFVRGYAVIATDSGHDLAVNSDPKEKLQTLIKDKTITWKCWFDGGDTSGPIASRWNVHGWPTVYLIDRKGVIRFKDHGLKEKDLNSLFK